MSFRSFPNPVVYPQGDCKQTYCLDKANASCPDPDCCTCVCDNWRFPFVDIIAKKCVRTLPTTQPSSTQSVTSTLTTNQGFTTLQTTTSAVSWVTGTTLIPPSSSTKKTETSTNGPSATAVNQKQTGKASLPAGAIVGGVAGVVILVIICIAAFCLWKRRKSQTTQNRPDSPTKLEILTHDKIENGNDIYSHSGNASLLLKGSVQNKNIEVRGATNPYYKPTDKGSRDQPRNDDNIEMENLYYRPADVGIAPAQSQTNNVYYSSAGLVDEKRQNDAKSGSNAAKTAPVNQEYSYARSDLPRKLFAADRRNPDQDTHYKALGNTTHAVDTYQSLDDPLNSKPPFDPANQEQMNLYYESGIADNESQRPEASISDPDSKLLSLKNNAGSRENIDAHYQIPEVGTTEPEYQALSAPSQNPQYAGPKEEYLDMSGVDNTAGEYMYASMDEQRT